jgi:hypothetical protein
LPLLKFRVCSSLTLGLRAHSKNAF